MASNVKPLMSPGGKTLLNISKESHEGVTPQNAKFSHRLVLDLGSDSPDATTEFVVEKVLQENKKEERKSRSDACPTARIQSGKPKRFTWGINEIPDRDYRIRIKIRELQMQKIQETFKKTNPNIYLYDPSP